MRRKKKNLLASFMLIHLFFKQYCYIKIFEI